MSTKSPWGKVGAWAAEAEREEEEERAAIAASKSIPQTTFPSLKESVSNPTTKTKKKTKMTLQEFNTQSSTKLTHQEMLSLPTGPKERSADEYQRGFSNYGSRIGSNSPRSFRFEEGESGERRGRGMESDMPSRSDGVDNWGSMKREMTNTRQDMGTGSKYGALGGGGSSRADEVDNWGSGKKFVPQMGQMTSTRQSSFGSGFSRPDTDRWTRNEMPRNEVLRNDRPESERWTKNEVPRDEGEVVVVEKVNRGNPFGAARPREEVLAEKGLDWKKIDLEVEEKSKVEGKSGSRPGSSQSSKSESVGGEVKERKKVNPFGEAKPREVLLEEKGLDWKKIDLELEHKGIDRPETEEEKNLKQEMENLNKELLEKSGDEKTGVQELIHKMEQELDLLVRELDDKVRYTQKTYERPGSGSGRPPSRPGSYEDPRAGFQDRTLSRPGSFEDSRVGYQDRPPSRPGAYEESRVGLQDRPPSRPGAYEDPRFNYHDRPRSRPGAYEEPRSGFAQRSFSSMGGGYQGDQRGAGGYQGDQRGAGGYQGDQRGAGGYQVDPRGGGGYQVDPRAGDYNERPRSRGTVNSWTRPGDDRRGVQGGGGRGFFGSREEDRSGSRW